MQHPIHIPPSAPARLVVLASGTGSLLQSLLSAAVGDYPARVAAVGVDRDCRAVEIAQAASIPTFCVRLKDHPSRADWDTAIAEIAERLTAIKDAHGGDKILFYSGGGQGNHLPAAYGQSLRAALGLPSGLAAAAIACAGSRPTRSR